MVQPERENFISDLIRETCDSWRAMPAWSRVALVVGAAGFVGLQRVHVPGMPEAVMIVIRIASLLALMAGAISNARALDEFYQRVYLQGCAVSVIASIIVLYTINEFKINIGVRSVSVLIFFWLVGYIVSFARLRRA